MAHRAVPIPVRANARRTAAGRRRPRRRPWWRPGCAATRSSSTASCTCRSSSSWSSASTAPTGGSPTGTVSASAGTRYVLGNREIQRYLINSFIVGIATAFIATIVGTMAALGPPARSELVPASVRRADLCQRHRPGARHRARRPSSSSPAPSGATASSRALTGVEIGFGYHTIVSALSLFNISLVLLLVRARLSGMDRTHVEASYDLFATPWRTFWQITFPQLLPAIVAGLPAVVHVRLRRLPDHDVRQRARDVDASRCSSSARSSGASRRPRTRWPR